MKCLLMFGDSIQRMKEIDGGSVDLILADPPYQITDCSWDSIIPFEPMWEQLLRIIKPTGAIVMTASQPFTTKLINSNLKLFRYCWVWQKSHPSGVANANKRPLKYHEEICVFYQRQPTYNPQKVRGKMSHSQGKAVGKLSGGVSNPSLTQLGNMSDMKFPSSVIYVVNPRNGLIHPTQKPVELGRYLIKTYSNPGETVLDFTCGSGSFVLSALVEGRNAIGIDNGLCKKDTEIYGIKTLGKSWVELTKIRILNEIRRYL